MCPSRYDSIESGQERPCIGLSELSHFRKRSATPHLSTIIWVANVSFAWDDSENNMQYCGFLFHSYALLRAHISRQSIINRFVLREYRT